MRVLAYRHDRPAGMGYAHSACAGGAKTLDLTGKPDYGDYISDRAHPAYRSDYDASEQGHQFDAALQEEARKEAAASITDKHDEAEHCA